MATRKSDGTARRAMELHRVEVVAPEFLNVARLESLLSAHQRSVVDCWALTFDMSEVTWISPLSMITLGNWFNDICAHGGRVSVILPPTHSFAGDLLWRAGFARVLALKGMAVAHPFLPLELPGQRWLAAYESFATREQAEQHLRALSAPNSTQTILQLGISGDFPEIVSTGAFHSLVLRELLDNSFHHGGGVNVSYAAVEVKPAADRRRAFHSMFAPFDDKGYVEICVGDAGARNLVSTLKRFVPPGFTPQYRLRRMSPALDAIDRTILYAFEFGATSDPGHREHTLSEKLDREKDAGLIATGLFELASLTRAYGGEILVRAGSRLVVVSYAEEDIVSGAMPPRAATWRAIGERSLAKVAGTIVMLRIPKDAQKNRPMPRTKTTTHIPSSPIADISVRVVGLEGIEHGGNDAGLIRRLEVELDREFGRPLVRSGIVAIILDGIRLESKFLGYLLVQLSRMRRNGWGMVVLTDDARACEVAREQWNRYISSTPRAVVMRHSFVGLCIIGPVGSTAVEYGEPTLQDSTTLAGDTLVLPGGTTSIKCNDLSRIAREVLLGRAIRLPTILQRKERTAYLLEGSYYTTSFVSVQTLLETAVGGGTARQWTLQLMAEAKWDHIIVFKDYLVQVLATCAKGVEEYRPTVECLDQDHIPGEALSFAERYGTEERCALFLDVLCTGKKALDFIAKSAQKCVSVVALVDARYDNPGSYLTVLRESGPQRVPVIASSAVQMRTYHDRPEGVAPHDVFVVDRHSNALTRQWTPSVAHLSSSELNQRLRESNALSCGHYALRGKHYHFFVSMRLLFAQMPNEVASWLRQELHGVVGHPHSELIDARCFDDDTGLLAIAERARRDSELGPVALLSREQVERNQEPSGTIGRTVWLVMPVLITGELLMACMDYVTSRGARRVHVSIVVARCSQRVRTRVENLQRYGGSEVSCEVYCHLPLRAYRVGQCPLCRVQSSYEGMRNGVKRRFIRLRDAVEEAVARYQVVAAESAGLVGSRTAPWFTNDTVEEAELVSLYEEGQQLLAARNGLIATLDDPRRAVQFLAAFGRSCGDDENEANARSRVIYKSDWVQAGVNRWLETNDWTSGGLHDILRGLARIAPETLRENLDAIIGRACEVPGGAGVVACETVLNAELFGDSVTRAVGRGVGSSGDVLREALEFTRTEGSSRQGESIRAIHEVEWHLTRSEGWGAALDLLGSKNRRSQSTVDEIEAALRRFMVEGCAAAEQKVYAALRTGRAMATLYERNPEVGAAWVTVQSAVQGLVASVRGLRGSQGRESVAADIDASVESIEAASKKYTELLQAVACQPWRVIGDLYKARRDSGEAQFEMDLAVDPECGAMAMHADDFEEIMEHILDNAQDMWAARRGRRVRVTVSGDRTARHAMVVEARDDCPDRTPPAREGGLARVRDLCARWGAVMSLEDSMDGGPAESGQSMTLRVKIAAMRWPLE